MLADMRFNGVQMPNPPLQPSEQDWIELAKAWERMGREIQLCESERFKRIRELGSARMEQGLADVYNADDYPAPDPKDPNAKDLRPWVGRDPDQEVMVTYRDNPRTGREQVFVVRMLPGTDAKLDAAVAKSENAKRMRVAYANTAFAPYLPYLNPPKKESK